MLTDPLFIVIGDVGVEFSFILLVDVLREEMIQVVVFLEGRLLRASFEDVIIAGRILVLDKLYSSAVDDVG